MNSKVLSALSLAAAISFSGVAGATVTFNISYDDFGGNQRIDTVIGTGTLSYDGPLAYGWFPLSSLTGLAYDVTISGQAFTIADIHTDEDSVAIFVFDLGGGLAGMVFTGKTFGSFDLMNSAGYHLSHEPTAAFDDPVGCCGGNGVVNLYAVLEFPSRTHDYQATTAVPEPATLVLLGLGLAGLAASRNRRPVA